MIKNYNVKRNVFLCYHDSFITLYNTNHLGKLTLEIDEDSTHKKEKLLKTLKIGDIVIKVSEDKDNSKQIQSFCLVRDISRDILFDELTLDHTVESIVNPIDINIEKELTAENNTVFELEKGTYLINLNEETSFKFIEKIKENNSSLTAYIAYILENEGFFAHFDESYSNDFKKGRVIYCEVEGDDMFHIEKDMGKACDNYLPVVITSNKEVIGLYECNDISYNTRPITKSFFIGLFFKPYKNN